MSFSHPPGQSVAPVVWKQYNNTRGGLVEKVYKRFPAHVLLKIIFPLHATYYSKRHDEPRRTKDSEILLYPSLYFRTSKIAKNIHLGRNSLLNSSASNLFLCIFISTTRRVQSAACPISAFSEIPKLDKYYK